jgi:hypothetical protein
LQTALLDEVHFDSSHVVFDNLTFIDVSNLLLFFVIKFNGVDPVDDGIVSVTVCAIIALKLCTSNPKFSEFLIGISFCICVTVIVLSWPEPSFDLHKMPVSDSQMLDWHDDRLTLAALVC